MDWYYQKDGQQVGPLSDEEFEASVKAGSVRATTMVWNETMNGWLPHSSLFSGGIAAVPQISCSQCLRQFPQTELIRYQTSWICASCKPLFFQRLKEGGSVAGIYEYGQFWPRAAAKIIDGLILGLVSGMFLALAFVTAIAFPQNEVLAGAATLFAYAISLAAAVGYNAYFLPKHGSTPGKMALGLKVISADGSESVTVQRAIGRYFAEMLSYMMCYVGYIMAAFDEESRTLHDRLCNTRVVKK